MKYLFDAGHGIDTLGKCSPKMADGTRYKEWAHTRLIARRIVEGLKARGKDAELITPEDRDIPLSTRSARVNAVCKRLGAQNVALVSIHSNAAGSGETWANARGWAVYTSPGQTKADILATKIWEAMDDELTKAGYRSTFTDAEIRRGQRPMRADYSDGDPDYEARFHMLTATACPAVLTENLFHDNIKDVEFLTSEAGINAIVNAHIRGVLEYEKYLKL